MPVSGVRAGVAQRAGVGRTRFLQAFQQGLWQAGARASSDLLLGGLGLLLPCWAFWLTGILSSGFRWGLEVSAYP